MENRDVKFATQCGIKVHKSKKSIEFISKCLSANVYPKFTRIPKYVIERAKLSPNYVSKLKKEKLQNELNIQNERYLKNLTKFNTILKKLHDGCVSEIIYDKLKSDIFTKIKIEEQFNDLRREKLWDQLNNIGDFEYAQIEIYNYTQSDIPEHILNTLKYGAKIAIGGRPNKFENLAAFDLFYQHWQKHAEEINVDPFEIIDVRANLMLQFGHLNKCFSNNKDTFLLNNFLNKNPNILLLEVDKSKNLIFINKHDYITKLNNIFGDTEKFEKLQCNPLNKDLDEFKKLIRNLKPYFTEQTYDKIWPNESLKKGYGICKLHKDGAPLRPIVSSVNSITSGAEDFINNLIKPLLKECIYSVDSNINFKNSLLKNRIKFDAEKHEIVSFDVKSLYTNINVNKVLTYIFDKIFKNPRLFFSEFNFDPEQLKLIIKNKSEKKKFKEIFTNFVTKTILQFSSFSSLDGYYRQTSGVSMGSKLSPLLSNLFMTLLETSIVKRLEKSGEIIFWIRYADDVFCIIEKEKSNFILTEINKFDSDLQFTLEKMTENAIPFLDMTIYLDVNNTLQTKFYQKPSASEVVVNFQKSISPKRYKINSLITDLHRCKNTCTTEENMNDAIFQISKKYQKNGFPIGLIKDKISLLKQRDFKPAENKEEREIERKITLINTSI